MRSPRWSIRAFRTRCLSLPHVIALPGEVCRTVGPARANGTRWAFNDLADTSILDGPVVDYRSGEIIAFLETERRFGDRWVAEVEARWLLNTDALAPVHDLRRDDFLALRVSRFF